MRLHRFYIKKFSGKPGAELNFPANTDNERLLHQWRDIFRFEKGDTVLVFNQNEGEWKAEFISLTKKEGAILQLIEKGIEKTRTPEASTPDISSTHPLVPDVHLYLSIIKNSNFDLVVEKATELGVSRIIPIITDRTIKSNLNFERLNKLAIEASEQSGRLDIPEISEIMSLKEAVSNAKQSGAEVFFGHISHISESEHSANIDKTAELETSSEPKSPKMSIFIGPEGGWTPEEVELFEKEGVKPISLGRNVLRAETAAIIGVSKLVDLVR